MNVGVAAADGRQVEVLAQGSPCRGGKQLAVDVILQSSLSANGEPKACAATLNGDAYPELGGVRWSWSLSRLEGVEQGGG